MSRFAFFIDGFNVYHSLQDNKNFHKYKWLNYYKLCSLFIKKTDTIEEIFYFTALAHWDVIKKQKHQLLIKVLEANNVKTIYGEFKRKDKFCHLCNKKFRSREEKETDVNIAIHLLELAFQNKYDKAIIISADSDLIPAIKGVQRNFPNKQIGIIFPLGRRSESLKQIADFYMKIKEKHLQSSLFPKTIKMGNDQIITCPESWQ